MELIRGKQNIAPQHHGCVATIGNFDGVHKGHQLVIKKLCEKAKVYNLPATVILFEPHPMEFFLQDKAAARLMRLREKLLALQDLGVDRVVCLRFNKGLANTSAESFIENILVSGLGVAEVTVGDDFRFGHQRKGDVNLLKEFASQNGFEVIRMDACEVDGERVSSTRVRKALEAGDLSLAEKLLGRPFAISGYVAHGDKRGRIIGFPTANIYLHRKSVPILGVYAVKMFGIEKQPIFGVANVGNRPTVDGTRSLLEVHLFNFNKDIYGQHVRVEFVKKLRDEIRFDSLDALKQQIFRDAEQAKALFFI